MRFSSTIVTRAEALETGKLALSQSPNVRAYRIALLAVKHTFAIVSWTLLLAVSAPLSGQRPSSAPAYEPFALSTEYKAVQTRLARGWNTWDVNSVATHVLLPQGLAIHVGLKHNTSEGGEALLNSMEIGRLSAGAEQVFPGAHAWDGSYTDLRVSWKGHEMRLQSAHEGEDLVVVATPLQESKGTSGLLPTLIFSVDYLWNLPGTVEKQGAVIRARSGGEATAMYCTCADEAVVALGIAGRYFAAEFGGPVAVSTGRRRSVAEARAAIERARERFEASLPRDGRTRPIVEAIETTLGWDTIYEPEKGRVVSPVSRIWSVNWGGYVIFDWDTFFAATMASIGDRDLAYADAIETLRESTAKGFVPNYARSGHWKSFDRSEPPVGAITVLGLYRKFGDRWFIEQAFQPLLNWNRWWSKHRDADGYLAWGSDGENVPRNVDDKTVGMRAGAILESGLDNSPMYDSASYDQGRHLLRYADVGLMSMYIADCDALAAIADALGRSGEAKEVRSRRERYAARLQSLWSGEAGIFLNKDLQTGQFNYRLSPTNFYPMLARVATPDQASRMVREHLLNPDEFWGEWVIPSIARNDPAFNDQNYWRGRIWGPMNYLVYLGLQNYDLPQVRREFADESYALFFKEWSEHGHVHENYNAMLGTGDDVSNSDRFYHWGALLGYIEYLSLLDARDSVH